MPQSKNRPRHHQHHPHAGGSHPHTSRRKTSPVIIAVLFFALFGLGISYFVSGSSKLAMLVGTIIGGAAGYLFGQQINQAFTKK
ncbi:MAG: hypothetical protein Q7T76_17015 [Ferruginibacter sp.]|nr:hypothetical protein [Ferruginibacter sp.]